MNKEVESIIHRFRDALTGSPWFNRAIYGMLDEVPAPLAAIRPSPGSHSCIDLVYHMITWTDFAWQRVEGQEMNDPAAFELLDWRQIDPQIHGWEEGIAWFRESNEHLLVSIGSKPDSFLDEPVRYRDYNFRTLLHGLADHHIYHMGQVMYALKLLGDNK